MIIRTLSRDLETWSTRQNPSPLLITGARQTGKASLILELAPKFGQMVHIRLEEQTWKKFFLRDEPPSEMLSGLFFLTGKSPSVKRTLFFFEEIQESPEAVSFVGKLSALRPGSFLAASASRLTRGLDQWPGPSDGIPARFHLFPCTFSEFLGSLGDPELEQAYREVPIPAFLREKLIKKFQLYSLTGGMPEVLRKYSQDRHLSGLRPVFEEILETQTRWALRGVKNERSEKMIRNLLQNSFPFAATRIRFRGFGNAGDRSRETGEVFRHLERMMLVRLIYPSTRTEFPVDPDTGRFPRLHIPDTGMVSHFSGIQKELYHSTDLGDLFSGQISRQLVAQELRAANPRGDDLHFWVRRKLQSGAEVDFLVRHNNLAIPVEVSSGEPGRLRSLHQFMDEAPHPYAVRLYNGPVSIRQTKTIRGKEFFLLSLPYFLAGRIGDHLDGLIKFVNAV
jgi:predicted AAA+ superfamily ATPase